MSSYLLFEHKTTGAAIMWPRLSGSVQVGSSVKVKWQNCKFSLTAQAPLREYKCRQPVVVTHCFWQGDDEHLSLKGWRYWLFISELVLVLMSVSEEAQRQEEGAIWGITSAWLWTSRTSVDECSKVQRNIVITTIKKSIPFGSEYSECLNLPKAADTANAGLNI